MWMNWIVRIGFTTFLLFLYGYRLAIGYFRVVKSEGGSYPRFPCGFRGHDPTLCFWFWSTKGLGFGRPAGTVDSNLEAPRSYADVRVCSRTKTGLVLWDFNILFGVLLSVVPGAWLAGVCSDTPCVSMLGSDGRGRGWLRPHLGLFTFC
jgi:hypothetical protein